MTGELNNHLMCVLKAIKPNVLPSGLIYWQSNSIKWGCYYPHFIGNKTEAQRGKLTCPVWHSLGETEPGYTPKLDSFQRFCSF